MPDTERGLGYRIQQLEEVNRQLNSTVEAQNVQLARLEPLPAEVKSLRKAAYWVAGVIVTGAIGFAFSVLALVPL